MIDAARNLTDHFTLCDLTNTSHAEFQKQNRLVTPEQIVKLTALAKLLEHVVFVLGTPLNITSAYRCLPLNRAVGGTDRSQHVLCEAADFVPAKMDLGAAFRRLWKDVTDKNTNVGQLIHETTPNGEKSWVHISLGTPYRDAARNKQILRYENGTYTRLA